MSTYTFKNGARIPGVKPQDLGDALAAIPVLTPETVVEAAASPKHVLHSYIWGSSDEELATEARLLRAGYAIRSLELVIVPNTPSVRAFVNIVQVSTPVDQTVAPRPNVDPGRVYLPISQVMSDDELRAQLLDRAKMELKAWRIRYNDLRELARVFEVVDVVLQDAA